MGEALTGGNHWGILSRNLEGDCVHFQQATLVGGNYGGIFLEIWRGFAWISKKQYWWEETIGDFLQKFGEGLRGFPESNIGGRKVWGNIF